MDAKKILELTAKQVGKDNCEIVSIASCIKEIKSKSRLGKCETFGLLIYIPELTVTNELNYSHLVRKLFIYLPFFKGQINLSRSFTFRMMVTENEYNYGYCTSHTNSLIKTIYDSTTICYGSGTPIEISQEEYNRNPSEMKFEYFLKNFLYVFTLESLEGVPYKYINFIGYEIISSDVINYLDESSIADAIESRNEIFNDVNYVKLSLNKDKIKYKKNIFFIELQNKKYYLIKENKKPLIESLSISTDKFKMDLQVIDEDDRIQLPLYVNELDINNKLLEIQNFINLNYEV